MESINITSSELLRRKAEELVKIRPLNSIEQLSKEEIQEFIYEFEVHQKELELQLEELKLQVESQMQLSSNDNDASCQNALSEYLNDKYIDLEINGNGTGLYNIIQTIPDLIWLKDTNGVFLICNKMFERFFGATENEIVGKTDYDFVDKELADFFRERDWVAMDTGKSTSNEEWITFADDGHRAFLETIKTPMFDNKGQIIGVLGVGRDITERNKTEVDLREKEVQYNNLANSGPALVWKSDKDKLHYYFNESWLKFTGRTLEQELGNSWAVGVYPDDFNQYLKTYVTAFDIQKSFEMEYRLRHASGEYRWILDMGTPNYNSSGEFIGYIGNCFDISERKKVEIALLISEEKFKKAFTTSPDSININRLEDGLYISINDGFTRILGYTEDEVIGKSSIEFDIWVNIEDRQKLINGLITNGFVENLVAQFRCKNGELVYGMMSAQIIELEGIKHILSITRDVNDKTLTENALTESKSKLDAALSSMTDSILITDAEGKYIEYNEAYIKFIRLNNEDNLPIDFNQFGEIIEIYSMAGELISKEKWIIPRALRGENATNVEYILKKKDSGESWIGSYSFNPILDDKGSIVGSVVVARDVTELKKADKILLESERRFRELLSSVKMLSVILDMQGNIIFCNEYLLNLTHWKKEEILGKNWFENFLPKEVLKDVYGVFEKVHDNGIIIANYENTILTKEGDEILIAWNNTALFDENGKINGVASLGIDITAQKKAELALQLSEENFRAIFESNSAPIAIFEADTTISMANDAYCKLSGYTLEELIGMSWSVQIPPEDMERLKEYDRLRFINSKNAPDKYEFTFWRKNGEIRNAIVSVALIENSKKIITSFIDITDRKQAENALKDSEEKYRRITDNITDVVWMSDLKLNISYVSPSVKKLFGISEEEHIKRPQYKKFPPESLLVLTNGMKQEMEMENNPTIDKNRSRSFELEYFKGDGSIIWVEIKVSFIRDEQGIPIGLQGMTRDISDRKRAEIELRDSEERYRLITSVVSDYIFTSAIDENNILKLSWVAGAFEQITGYTYEEYIQIGGWRATMHPDDLEKDDRDIAQLQNNKNVITDIRTYAKDGRLVWVRVYAHPIWDAGRNMLIGIYGGVKDITESILAEKALLDSNERLKIILESNPIALWDWDLKTDKWFATQNYYTMLGYKPESGYPDRKVWLNRAHPEDREMISEKLTKVLNFTDDQYEYDARMLHADGSFRWQTVSGQVVARDSEGRATRLIGVRIDIDERKKAEDALRESEEKLRTLFASMTEMVAIHEMVFDEFGNAVNYRIIDCNNAFTVITGIKKEDAIGKLATELYATEVAPYLNEYATVSATGNSLEFNTYFAPIEKYFLISVVSSGKNKFSTITKDITDIQQINEVIKAKNKELENYIYVTSHDLRSPLVNIQGFSQRLQKQTDEIITVLNDSQLDMQLKEHLNKIITEGIPKTLDFILSNVSKMDMLINGLLQLSRTGRIVMTVKKIDMNRLIKSIISTYNFQITEMGAKVHISDLPDCYGDENQLNQLFSNIIGNAIKYRDKNKQLELKISAHPHHNNLIYSIADTGIGMSPTHLIKIWDVFYRVDPTSTEAGDGIGLSLAKRIVDKHKGKIWVESEPGIGSTFFVELHKNEFEE